ncbi:MAG TPA: ABC transporter ATP-binding protein [Candidatus Limnocylindrales bacterium]|nr:ABC transporter ATP-binding protein [Candidatus Limnocylindrales bacterium]
MADFRAASPPAIELVEATKRYGSAVALDRVSMQIDDGEFFCLLGPSGCGKTTTLNLIGGFIPLSSGELRIEGERVNDLPPHKRNVNTVFQAYALFPHMTVAQNIAFGLRMEGLGSSERASRVDEHLELVGLRGFGVRYPAQLSGGQQQRVALARALVKRPAVLLLDEPLGALDLKLRRQMQLELSRIHRQVGTTFVFVTHDQEEALSMATRIAVMSGGHVVQVGTPSQIYHRPVDRFVADFIGESNFLEGRVDGGSFVLPDRTRLAIRPGAAPGAATLMVRPEVLEVTGPQEGRAGCLLPGRVVGMSFMGNHTRITLETAAGALVVHRAHQSGAFYDERSPGIGEEACVWWATEQSTILTSTSGGEN